MFEIAHPIETTAASSAAAPAGAPNEFKVAPELKTGHDGPSAYGELLSAFEEFKVTNEQRLKELERRSPDVLTEDRLDRLSAKMDAQFDRLAAHQVKASRPALEGGTQSHGHVLSPDRLEHRRAFEGYLRGGQEMNLKTLEEKAMSIGSGPDGGYLVPIEIEHAINQRMFALSPIRSIATVREVSSATYQRPFMTTGPAVGWVAETASRPQTTSPTLSALTYPTMELYAMPAATQTLLDDAVVNLDQWIADEVDSFFAIQEGAAFITGDGVTKPKGFLSYTNAPESAFAWGGLGYTVTGVAGALPSSNPSDVLIDLIYTLKAGYRQNASWVMNRRTQAALRKLKDSTGNYLWQPPASADGKASLAGFALVEAEDMPDIGNNSTPIAFGDFRAGYLVVDRKGVRVLRDPYSAKPYVLFYTTKRVGGGVQDFDAIKLLKFGTA